MVGNVFLEQMFLMSMLTINGIMVSHAGADALSGVSVIDQVHLFMSFLFLCSAYGVVVVVAQAIGADRYHEVPGIGRQAYLMSLALSAFCMLAAIFLGGPVCSLLLGKAEQAIFDSGLLYLRVYALSYPFFAFYSVSISILRGRGNTRAPMIISVAMNLVNITLNALFIYVFNLGVIGAALSVIIARVFAALLCAALIRRAGLYGRYREFFTFKPTGRYIRSLTQMGMPPGLESLLFQIGRIVINMIVVSAGSVHIAANAIVLNGMDMVGCGGLVAYTIGIPMMGWAKGQGDRALMKKTMRNTLLMSHGFLAVTALAMMPLIQWVAGLYNVDPEALRIGRLSILTYGFASVLLYPSCFVIPGVLRGAGDARVLAGLSVAVVYTVRIPATYIFCLVLRLGAFGAVLAMLTDWVFRASGCILRMARGKWLPPAAPAEAPSLQ